MKRIIGLLIVTLACLRFAGAQPDPDQPLAIPPDRQPKVAARVVQNLLMQQQKAIVQSTPHGVFVLRNGILALLDTQTLQPKNLLELFPPPPPPPGPQAPFAAAPPAPVNVDRLYPASLLPFEDDLLILIGDHLFRVDAAAVKPRYDADLSGPFGQAANRWRELATPPALELKGDMLYIVRATQMCVVNVREGKLLATVQLPPALQINAPRAPQARRDQPADGQPPEPPREVTLVGTVLQQQDGAKTLWTLSTAEDAVYILEGDGLGKLLATPNAEGIRARIIGTLRVDENLPDFADGRLEIKEFQILPK